EARRAPDRDGRPRYTEPSGLPRFRHVMGDPVSAFLRYLEDERGASPHTVRNYRLDLAEFGEFLRRSDVTPTAATGRVVRAWMAALHQRRLAKSTVARKLASVRSCFRFLARRGLIEQNPARQIRRPRPVRRLPSFLPKDESKDLLDRSVEPSEMGRRDHALLELLYATGIRVAECCGLDWSDLDLRQRTVRVLGKGDKERMVPLGEAAAVALESYLALRAAGRGPLF